jgi:ribonuclease P protein component
VIRRANRFHGHNAVSRLRGNVYHDSNLSLRYAKNTKSDYRLAVVVSKKTASSAVVRNRIRRRVFEIVRTGRRTENIPIDMVIYIKTADVAKLDSEQLANEVSNLIKKALSRL